MDAVFRKSIRGGVVLKEDTKIKADHEEDDINCLKVIISFNNPPVI